MKRLIAVVLAGLCLAGCTVTNTKLGLNLASPPAGARVLLVKPDVQLAVLTAGGVDEARADWSQQGQSNLEQSVATQLKSKSYAFKEVDPNTIMSGRSGQLIRLHQAVGESILTFGYGLYALPTKKAGLDWTLGDGAKALADSQGADYALFVHASGNYASGGRVATAVGMAVIGVHIPLGSQTVFASLVDLRTGQVVWFNTALAGPSDDMRTPAGAATLTTSLLTKIPL